MAADKRMERIEQAADWISARSGGFKPIAGIILGSGLGKLAESIEAVDVIPYSEIPSFPVSTVTGHKGNLILGYLGGCPVIAMQGRFHYYEGYPMEMVTLPERVMATLGVQYLFVSNAAGGLNRTFRVGDLMVITDHINMMPNPLIGPNLDAFGERFPDMTHPYDESLLALSDSIAAGEGIALRHGVYLGTSGPTYETPAEVRFYTLAGADAVGMSTVPEVIVARHCGMRVFGVSVITNISNADISCSVLNDGDDVVKTADAAADRMTRLFTGMISAIGKREI